MGACLEGCCLHYLKRCPCCICDCCYGSALKPSFVHRHERKGMGNKKTVFNSAFGLILYDKWVKESDVWMNRERIFDAISSAMDGYNKKVVVDLVVLDVGVGTGAFTEALSDKFLENPNDTLICTDISAQSLHFVRTRVVDKNEKLKNRRIEYFNNDANALCLDNNYNDNEIDLIFMSFTMNHISATNGDRHAILKEIYALCKENGFFILFEFGSDFLKQYEAKNDEENADKALLNDNENDGAFKNWEAMKAYVEEFGFEFVQRIMPQTFGDNFWIFLFKKPAKA